MQRLGAVWGAWWIACVAGLSGCASMDRSFESMAVSHNQTLDQIERSNLLQNILRASDHLPISFTTVSYVSGNGSVGASVNASNSFGRLLHFITGVGVGGGLNVNQGFGYSLSTLDNELFTRSFLADVPMDRLHFLSEGTNLDNLVLYTLVIKRLHRGTVDVAQRSSLVTNDVQPQAWNVFQGLLSPEMGKGLSMEMAPQETPVGPTLSRDEATFQLSTVIGGWNPSAWGPPQAGAARPVIKELPRKSSDADRSYQLVMVADVPRFCYTPPDVQSWAHDLKDLCRHTGAAERVQRLRDREAGAHGAARAAGAVSQSPGTATPLPVDWSLTDRRSPREVFYFVGQIVRAQLDRPGLMWRIGDPSSPSGARPLFNVVCADKPPAVATLAWTPYNGRICYVPRGDGSHSADVLQYLSLLVTMSKVPGAIPASPGVIIR